MNKKSSPSVRDRRRQPSTQRGRVSQAPAPRGKRDVISRVAIKVRDRAQAREETENFSIPARLRRMFFNVLVADGFMVTLIVVVSLATILLTGSPGAWLPSAIGEAWVVSNGAGVFAQDIEISMVPLLPACILFGLVARRVYTAVRKRVSLNDLFILLGWVVAFAVILALIAWFMLWDAAKVYELSPPGLPELLAKSLILHLSAMAVGMSPRLWRALAKRYRVPRAVIDGGVTATKFLSALAALAFVGALLLFAAGWDRQLTLMGEYPSITKPGIVSLILISIAYIPNIVIGIVSVVLGSEFHIGYASVSLFDTYLVPLPPLPVAAIIPGSSPEWAPVLLVLPVLAIAAALWREHPNIIHAVSTGLWTGLFTLIVVWFASGQVGAYGHAGPSLWLTAGLATVWSMVITLAVSAAWKLALARRGGEEPDSASATATDRDAESGSDSVEQDPDNVDSGNPDPDNVDPDNVDPDNVDPDNVDPDNPDPEEQESPESQDEGEVPVEAPEAGENAPDEATEETESTRTQPLEADEDTEDAPASGENPSASLEHTKELTIEDLEDEVLEGEVLEGEVVDPEPKHTESEPPATPVEETLILEAEDFPAPDEEK